ncbi:MAG: TlpA disulfide reductase family protein [Myxococcota bacterium]
MAAPESTRPPTPVGERFIGQLAPAWGVLPWVGTEPLRLADLQGQVVLVRFWTDTCPFCRATAPALAQIDADYRERGVTVIGMYHPKPRRKRPTPEQVAEVTAGWGWRFPVALDLDWAVLDSFWPPDAGRRYTSVSFVLDRGGTIRHVHPGPEYHPDGPDDHGDCRRDYQQIRATLDTLLAEPEGSPRSGFAALP